MVSNFFDKKFFGGSITTETMSNQQLAEELHKAVIKKFKQFKLQVTATRFDPTIT